MTNGCRAFFGALTECRVQFEVKELQQRGYLGYSFIYFNGIKFVMVYITTLDRGYVSEHYSSIDELLVQSLKTFQPFDHGKRSLYADHVKKVSTEAINAWLIIAKRFRIVRDIRCMIARIVWNDRHLWIRAIQLPLTVL